jgi:RNA polymerase sigma factor (TIGR02999 family)
MAALRLPWAKISLLSVGMSPVTLILDALQTGDANAAERLLPLIYDELRKLAAEKMGQEKSGVTLQATALVHEAYMRLVDQNSAQQWKSRGHFFAAAAEAMRRILIEQARRRHAIKRGGLLQREELDGVQIVSQEPDEELLAVNDALEQLASADPAAANLVRLRFFAGLNMSEAAEVLDISVRSAHTLWAYARSWLRRQMRSE